MKKVLVFLLVILLSGCKSEANIVIDDGYVKQDDLRLRYVMCMSGTCTGSDTITIYKDEYYFSFSSFSFDHRFIEDPEYTSITVSYNGKSYLYNLIEGEWVEYIRSYPSHRVDLKPIPGPDLDVFRELDLTWFEEIPDDHTSLKEEYDLKSKEMYRKQIFNLLHDVNYDDVVTENSWGSYDCYIRLNDNDEIVAVFYTSFPSWQIEYLEVETNYVLPQSIKGDLGIK